MPERTRLLILSAWPFVVTAAYGVLFLEGAALSWLLKFQVLVAVIFGPVVYHVWRLNK